MVEDFSIKPIFGCYENRMERMEKKKKKIYEKKSWKTQVQYLSLHLYPLKPKNEWV